MLQITVLLLSVSPCLSLLLVEAEREGMVYKTLLQNAETINLVKKDGKPISVARLRPGDEVLILAPYWPLIEGIVRSFHGTRPFTVISPRVGTRIPVSILIVVDLPAPFGPR